MSDKAGKGKAAPEAQADGDAKKGKDKKAKGVARFQDEKEEEWVNTTPKGQLKDFSQPMDEKYNPVKVEAAWADYWDQEKLFTPEHDSKKEKFVIVIPPPNVTGTLHLGHALTISVEDTVVRWNRMSGKNTLWVPGTDHAGIATQTVVEKMLARTEGKSRHDYGREAFLKKVWEWKEKNGNRIQEQTRRMGASVDWTREVFTMDEPRSKAVTEAFVRMYEDGLIYRADRMVNWSCQLNTAISTIEVDYEDIAEFTKVDVPGYKEKVEFGVIHSFAYRVKGTNDELVVSTTRLETMLGDVAVAVHPDDARYKKFHGKELEHPFIKDRKVLVVTDPVLVDMAFGTGAVKVTPGHDPNDFACGQRHKLPTINIFDNKGIINANGGAFAGQPRFEARKNVEVELKKLGLYKGKEGNKMRLGFCSRSGDVIEPVVRPQWFVNIDSMAKASVDAVRKGELQIVPKGYEQTWYDWLENPQPWCISRQLWWGHRIPAYFVSIKGEPEHHEDEKWEQDHWVVGRNEEEALKNALKRFPGAKAEDITLKHDDDVLDTWFSSGLFPFSVMNWPDDSKDMKDFFPGTLLETGADILFFWVARMVMMSLQLTKKLPFTHVYLHSMVRDKTGEKMSKSKGNVIDPLDIVSGCTLEHLHDTLRTGNLDKKVLEDAIKTQKQQFPEGIAQCGADALRFGLLAYTANTKESKINLDPLVIAGYRQFCNKLWNATRFALINFPADFQPPKPGQVEAANFTNSFADKWILNCLAKAVQAMNTHFRNYDFALATSAVYDFWLKELCDVYLELIKPVMREGDAKAKNTALAVLYTCLSYGLRLLAPMMPFVTEELYHRLPGMAAAKFPSICTAHYPKPAEVKAWFDDDVAEAMRFADEIAHANRSARVSMGLTKQRTHVYVKCSTASAFKLVAKYASDIATMAVADGVTALDANAAVPDGCISTVANSQCVLYIPAQGVDFENELVRLDKKRSQVDKGLSAVLKIVSGGTYEEKTPQAVKDKNNEKIETSRAELEKLDASIRQLESLMTPEQVKKYRSGKRERLTEEMEKMQKEISELEGKVNSGTDQGKPLNDKAKAKLETQISEKREEVEQLQKAMASLALLQLPAPHQSATPASPVQKNIKELEEKIRENPGVPMPQQPFAGTPLKAARASPMPAEQPQPESNTFPVVKAAIIAAVVGVIAFAAYRRFGSSNR